jgi:uncharacterized protein involved in exopolysaccharide biosynthesis
MTTTPPYSAGLGLRDVMQILVKHRITFISMFAVTIILTTLYTLKQDEIYESRAVLQVGMLAGNSATVEYLENPLILAERVYAKYGLKYRNQESEFYPYLDVVRAEGSGGSGALIVISHDSTADGAQNFIKQIFEPIIATHNSRSTEVIKRHKASLAEFRKRVQQAQTELSELKQDSLAGPGTEHGAGILLSVERSRLRAAITDLLVRINEMELRVLSEDVYVTRWLHPPSLNMNPVAPRIVLIAVIGFILAFLIGLVAAFISEAKTRP